MAVVMSSSLTVVRMGLALGWVETSLHNVLVAFPIALMASFLISSPIHRLVTWFASPTRPKPKTKMPREEGIDRRRPLFPAAEPAPEPKDIQNYSRFSVLHE
jgi:hypothetical protein